MILNTRHVVSQISKQMRPFPIFLPQTMNILSLSLQVQNKRLPIKAWLVSRILATIHKEKKDFPAVSSSGSQRANLGRNPV